MYTLENNQRAKFKRKIILVLTVFLEKSKSISPCIYSTQWGRKVHKILLEDFLNSIKSMGVNFYVLSILNIGKTYIFAKHFVNYIKK